MKLISSLAVALGLVVLSGQAFAANTYTYRVYLGMATGPAASAGAFNLGGASLSVDLPGNSYDFGIVYGNSVPAVHTFTITNKGAAPASFAATSLADGTRFHLQANTCSNAEVAPGASCTIDVGVIPNSPGVTTGTLRISDTTGNIATIATLSATYGWVALQAFDSNGVSLVTPVTLYVAPNGTVDYTFTAKNTGNLPIYLEDMSYGTTTCPMPGTLSPGSTCTVTIHGVDSSGGAGASGDQVDGGNAGIAWSVPNDGGFMGGAYEVYLQ